MPQKMKTLTNLRSTWCVCHVTCCPIFLHVVSSLKFERQFHDVFYQRRYKFTLFPSEDSEITREVVLNPSSIHFLAQNNMNLDLWTSQGIPFCTTSEASNLLTKFHDQQMKLSKSSKPAASRRKVELTRVEDKDFHARAMATLRGWLDSAIIPNEAEPEGVSLLLP